MEKPMKPYTHRQYPLFEWATATMMIGIALCILATPKTIEMGAFRFMLNAGFTPIVAVIIFAVAGFGRMFALFANGRFVHGAQFRAWGAVLGVFMWFHMMLALILLTVETGTLSVGIPVYAVLMFGEIVSCYRVAYETDRCIPESAGGKNDASTVHRSS
jgi:hypothetical protein